MGKIIVFSVANNNESTVLKNILSVYKQTVECNHIVVDDASTDNTLSIIKELKKENEKLSIIHSNIQKHWGYYAYREIKKLDPEDIVIILDMTDWFANPSVISYIKKYYETYKPLLTYGNHIDTKGIEFNSEKIIYGTLAQRKHREKNLKIGLPITFKVKLFNNIQKADILNEDKSYITNIYYLIYRLMDLVPPRDMKLINNMALVTSNQIDTDYNNEYFKSKAPVDCIEKFKKNENPKLPIKRIKIIAKKL